MEDEAAKLTKEELSCVESLVKARNRLRWLAARRRKATYTLLTGTFCVAIVLILMAFKYQFGQYTVLYAVFSVGSFALGLVWSLALALPTQVIGCRYARALQSACAGEGRERLFQHLMRSMEAGLYGIDGGYIGILGDIRDVRCYNTFIRILDYHSKDHRRMAAEALGNLGDQRAVPLLEEHLKDEDEGVRQIARVALKKLRRAYIRPPQRM